MKELIDSIEDYMKANLELQKVEFKLDFAETISRLTWIGVVALLVYVLFISSTLALAMYLNTVLESKFLGFVLMAGFYLLILVVLIVLNRKHSLEQILTKIIISKM
jgi:hypothetical protein